MNSIDNLARQIEEANRVLEQYRSEEFQRGSTYSTSISIKNLKEHLEELVSQLKKEKLAREKEVLELRLKGRLVSGGDIPLSLLGEISQSLSNGLLAAAQRLKYGEHAKLKIEQSVVQTLDLRLSGIAAGSTKLYITGNDSPDLFGNSLIEDALESAFALLLSEDSSQLADSASRMGKRSVTSLQRFLKAITQYDLELDMNWTSPREKKHEWSGDKNKVLSLSNALDSLQELSPVSIEIKGQLVMASLKGNFELMDDNDLAYKGTFPTELTKQIKMMHIGERCIATILEKSFVTKVTGFRKTYYSLEAIKPIEKP